MTVDAAGKKEPHMPLIVEEWSNNIWQRDLCNDTCYKSAYLFKNILENNQALSAMGYFALNDRLDEVPPSAETFHGGFGLFTRDDIPQSACLALELLARMGDRLLQQGEGYLVSQRGGGGASDIPISLQPLRPSVPLPPCGEHDQNQPGSGVCAPGVQGVLHPAQEPEGGLVSGLPLRHYPVRRQQL